jgi:hypothetical protein
MLAMEIRRVLVLLGQSQQLAFAEQLADEANGILRDSLR